MTKFIKFLHYDLKNGILSAWKYYLLDLVFFSVPLRRISAKTKFHTRRFCLLCFCWYAKICAQHLRFLPFSGAVGAPVRSDLIWHAALYR